MIDYKVLENLLEVNIDFTVKQLVEDKKLRKKFFVETKHRDSFLFSLIRDEIKNELNIDDQSKLNSIFEIANIRSNRDNGIDLIDEVNLVISELKEKGIERYKFLKKFRCPVCKNLKHKKVLVCHDCNFNSFLS